MFNYIIIVLSHCSHVQTLCNPVDRSPPGPPVHGILYARILEWVAISSSRYRNFYIIITLLLLLNKELVLYPGNKHLNGNMFYYKLPLSYESKCVRLNGQFFLGFIMWTLNQMLMSWTNVQTQKYFFQSKILILLQWKG